jgi:hypothetical protein
MDTGTIRATEDEALQFHSSGWPGKLSIAPTQPLTTRLSDLGALASGQYERWKSFADKCMAEYDLDD